MSFDKAIASAGETMADLSRTARLETLLSNCDFWITIARKKLVFDDSMYKILADDFSSIKEFLSEKPFTRINAIAGEQNQRGLR
jgi:hypothetical protein